jgi:hypothetical protein
MHDIISVAVRCGLILVLIILVVLVASRRGLKGRPWLLTYLTGLLLVNIVWGTLQLLVSSKSIGRESIMMVVRWLPLPLGILHIVLLFLLIPYVLIASSTETGVARDVTHPPRLNE